ncbi:hypothetical protein CVT26_006290 [Gymnopilus dilepis]|uniref:CxC1-like cysteine cluster associated with KDZ transposases domain-containing protein n=1 Tax=Gymnopilus dilepis TaxID=231916 RepID=A0A409Y0M8_9AGAR|nr:hypothetical protein CVT26_006290 [Gymnopilus dilepis]
MSLKPGFHVIDEASSRRSRRPVEGLLRGPGGVYLQIPSARTPDAVVDLNAELSHGLRLRTEIGNVHEREADEGWLEDLPAEDEKEENERARIKKEKQWVRWSQEVIPSMIKPYVSLLKETESLRNLNAARARKLCKGCRGKSTLQVSCIYFEKIENIVLCTCQPAALQLLSLGLFPCAPLRPTLAVDLNMLEFVRDLFLNSAPNTTAWAETLEAFLGVRQYKLQTRNTLRKRFGNALQWYAVLQDTKNSQVQDVLNNIRNAPDAPTPSSEDMESEGEADSGLERPSDYLRERCPMCFGGKDWRQDDELIDAIVCLDACFTQKRRKSQNNAWSAPREHPETMFVAPEHVEEMKKNVEEVRPSKHAKPAEDRMEPGMKVSSAILDECFDSFQAADSNRAKASTQFFADTGLMALLCRHDRVLWLVNMTSAGEKQYYALCLLEELFRHIPKSMRIGVLYDIGCQLHRSCVKHGFLEEVLDRIVFAISVFHAYGHQWPCQIIYHPRKCPGFGMSDGEGCERFWSSIKSLIPSLRVSGYHTRIYMLDTKVKHLDRSSLPGMGRWLARKWKTTLERKAEAERTLETVYRVGITEENLREEWANQVKEQTKPLPRQGKNLGDKEIQAILVLRDQLDELAKELANYQDMIRSGNYESEMTVLEVQEQLRDLQKKQKSVADTIRQKRSKLSIEDQQNLEDLLGNKFLQVRMNALAVKQRIRERLRHRKYELESLQQSYRKTMDRLKLETHAGQQLKRKEPGIQKLARTYNKLCDDMAQLIKDKCAPPGARVPSKVNVESLFKLDVDDDIWQDNGLTSDMDDALQVPGWLGNETIRKGIKALLLYDRCREERRRLLKERRSMQEWFTEEWNLANKALQVMEADPDLSYQLQLHKNDLLHLCLAWKKDVRSIPCMLLDAWGPTTEELKLAQLFENMPQVIYREEAGEDDDHDEDKEAYVAVVGDQEESSTDDEYIFENVGKPVSSILDLSDGEDIEDVEEAGLLDAMEEWAFAESFKG